MMKKFKDGMLWYMTAAVCVAVFAVAKWAAEMLPGDSWVLEEAVAFNAGFFTALAFKSWALKKTR